MEVALLLVAHCFLTVFVIVSFLCGHLSIFKRTPVRWVHDFLTYAAYDYFLKIVFMVFGARGRDFFLGIEYHCCERKNPLLQIFYVAIIGGVYYIIVTTTFQYIPSLYLSGSHRYISMLAVVGGFILFLLTSFTDPGTINSDNVSEYMVAYPYDNIIYIEKECSTCQITRPARSKHCRICDKCVARFDHHCAWMNTCIGEKNNRYFISFLLWHLIISLYGVCCLGLILAGQLKEHKVVYLLTVYYGIENSFSALFPHVVQWLVAMHNTQILLAVFLVIVTIMIGGFFVYHARLCLTNTTTNETFKWKDYISWKKKVNETKASAAALKECISLVEEEPTAKTTVWSKCKSFFVGKSPLQDGEPVVKNNVYDRGAVSNLMEIIVPLSERRLFRHKKLS